MKKTLILFSIFLTIFLLFLSFESIDEIHASPSLNIPYYTYTEDSNGHLIDTVDAYTPGVQIYNAGGERFKRPEHIFVDDNDYIYITDSQLRKVVILDEYFQFVTSLKYREVRFPKSTYVTDETIYVVEYRDTIIYGFDKKELLENNNVVMNKKIEPPTSPIFSEGYPYKPQHIVVDPRGNLYIQGAGSNNGLMMLDENGEFMTFFAGNSVRVPIFDRIRRIFLTDEQEEKMDQTFVDNITNLARDEKGFIYTVTSSLPNNPIKKFNIAGTNYLKRDMIGNESMNSIWIGRENNIITVDTRGVIYEYDQNGNLLFMFGGTDVTGNRLGLLNRPVSVATNSKDQILVLDQGGLFIQVYEPTVFTNMVHNALSQYQNGDYEESKESWENILQYNTMFDYAHIGLGDSYILNNNYVDAYQEYSYAHDYQGISDAFWGIRQAWLQDYLDTILLIIVILIVLRITYWFLNKKYDYSRKIHQSIQFMRKKNFIFDELMYIFTFLRHPFDGFYEIKRQKRVSVVTSTIIYLLLGMVFLLHYRFTNQIYVPKDNVNILYELFISTFVLILWIVSNYLICSISDGEGSIKNIYNSTAYSLSPILLIMPFIILFSNALTYQESVFYSLGFTIMILWTVFLMFFMIKDIHNYEVKETIVVIFKSIFTMLLIGLFLFIVSSLFNQLFSVLSEIIKEVSNQ